MFAKLLDGVLHESGTRMYIHGKIVTPSVDELLNMGYMPVLRTERPSDGKGYESYYEVENNVIVQKWRTAEPPPDPEEPFDVFMTEVLADHEFRLCLMELGVTEDDL